MKWFRRLKVGYKLALGFCCMIVLMLIIGLAGYRSIKNIQHNLKEIFNVRLPSIANLIESDRDLYQLLVAERSIIFANVKSDIFQELIREYETNLNQSEERWQQYKNLPKLPKEKEIIPEYEKSREEWKLISRKIIDGRIADTRAGRREALDLSLGIARQKFEEMRSYLDTLSEINLNSAQQANQTASITYKKPIISLFTIIGIGLFIGVFLSWAITRSITKPIEEVSNHLNQSSELVSREIDRVSSASNDLSNSAQKQASSLEETSASLEEMASRIKQNAKNAKQVDSLMKGAGQVVTQSNDSISELTTSMEEISKASEETSKIIKTIDEIAFQTNLLALNAAVEAARAGEAGAGFAVVADEVRNLAMRAAEAAKSTSDLIEGTTNKVKEGEHLVAKVNEAFSEVAKSTTEVKSLIAEIALASDEQAQGIEQLNKTVALMDKVTQQVAANAGNFASASQKMNTQVEQETMDVEKLIAIVAGRNNSREGETV